VQVFAAPAVGYVEVFVHATSLSLLTWKGKAASLCGAQSVCAVGGNGKLAQIANMAPAYNPAVWSTFFSAETGASAALVGLLFVAVSINLTEIVKMRQLVARSAKALFALMGVLIASILCMVPGQPVRWLGCELAILGLTVWLTTTLSQNSALRENPYVKKWEKVWLVILTQLSAIPVVAAGVSLFLGFGGGLYWLVPATILSFIAALIDAWVLLIEIQR
jgi:hypothetical protein